jgi:hypothetical protein
VSQIVIIPTPPPGIVEGHHWTGSIIWPYPLGGFDMIIGKKKINIVAVTVGWPLAVGNIIRSRIEIG